MTAGPKVFFSAVAVYLLGAFLAYGWRYNRPEPCTSSAALCEIYRERQAVVAAIFWPVAWPLSAAANLAIQVTRP